MYGRLYVNNVESLQLTTTRVGGILVEQLQHSRARNIHTLYSYRQSDLCIPINETARPHSNNYIHVSVRDLYIPSIGLPTWLQQIRQTDLGNI
jgi:hypothetical protein